MGRTQTFDTAEAVRAARGLFWEQGYEGSALPELERVTGLSRSSIYHAFGSKRGLFDAAVQSYLTEVIRPRLAVLDDAQVSPDALATYLLGLRDALLAGDTLPATSGCLLVNTAATTIAHDETVARIIADYRTELRGALLRGIRAQSPDRPSDEQETLADACTGLVVSAFSLVRVAPREAAHAVETAWNLVSHR